MRKTVFYCDRCGRQIDAEVYQIGTRFLNAEEGTEIDSENLAELCMDCHNETEEMTTWMILHPEIHFDGGRQITPQKPKDPKKQGNRKQIDLGKIAALYNAGWSVRNIAAEMHCAEQTIRNHLQEALDFLKRKNGAEAEEITNQEGTE